MTMQSWGLTDPGCVRAQNQDSYIIERLDRHSLLCVVCDGMGGAKSGNVASSLALDLSDEVCNYIANNVTSNVRQIEGTVKKLRAYVDLNAMEMTLENVTRAIADMFKSEGNALPTPNLIISQVCKFYSMDETVMRGTLKNKGTTEARQVAIYLIRKLTNLSTPDIGKELNKDHSTVIYSIRKVEQELKNGDENLQNHIRDITSNINSCL
jgi:chromosomal replication initiator protein